MDAYRTAGPLAGVARGYVRQGLDAAHSGILCRLHALESRKRPGQGIHSRNYRFPTLNDLYFQPGGNPDLQPEHGFTYDGGVSFAFAKEGRYAVHGEATWFDSYIDDWILWIPLGGKQDFWTPKNLKKYMPTEWN